MSLDECLDLGFAAYEQGQLQQARQAFEAALRLAGDDFDALHMLGVLALHAQELDTAVSLLQQAIAVDAQAGMAHLNLALALLQAGQARPALAHLQQAQALEPSPQVLLAQASAYTQLQDWPAAVGAFDTVLALMPDLPAAWLGLGDAHLHLGQWSQAEHAYGQGLQRQPELAAAWVNRASARLRLRALDGALADANQAIACEANHAAAWQTRGDALMALGQASEALDSIERALSLAPQRASAWAAKAQACVMLKQYTQAIEASEHALALDGQQVMALSMRASALQGLQRLDEAIAAYRDALRLHPRDAVMLANLCGALRERGLLDEARLAGEQASHIDPQLPGAWINLGNAWQHLGEPAKAVQAFEQALALTPHDEDLQWALGWCCLLTEDWTRGLAWFERRWTRPGSVLRPRQMSAELWLGDSPLAGRRILLHAEQGLGDTLQFCRYAPLLAQQGASVYLEVQAPLASLLSRLPGVIEVLSPGQSASQEFDLHCPLMSLPLAVASRPDRLPGPHPYLQALPSKLQAMHARLGQAPRPRIGLVWSGNPLHTHDHLRSMALQSLMAALPQDGWQYVCLQRDVRAADREAMRDWPGLLHWEDALEDFEDTAALTQAMDLVISVDTSLAHLAGALGRPCWVMLPKMCDWRWLHARQDSPWYPHTELLRQDSPGDWSSVLATLAPRLRDWRQTWQASRPA